MKNDAIFQHPKPPHREQPVRASRRRIARPARSAAETPARLPLLYIHTDEQWEALDSDVRLELLQFLTTLGPCSIREAALAMDAAPDGLYHHLRLLVASGLARETGERHTGRRREKLYDAAAERLRYDIDVGTGRNTERLTALLRAHLRRAERSFIRAIRAREMRLEGPIADTLFDSASAWLDDETAEKVRRHLTSALSIMAAARRVRRGRLYTLTAVMSPLRRPRGTSTPGDSDGSVIRSAPPQDPAQRPPPR